MKGTMCEHLGMEITEIGDDFLKGTLPVDERTQQHMGIIHGGASVVLAETLGSMASALCCEPGHQCQPRATRQATFCDRHCPPPAHRQQNHGVGYTNYQHR